MRSKKFIRDLYALAKRNSVYPINPDDSEEYIIDDRVAVEMAPIAGKDNYIHFVSIRALTPGNRHGSVAMKKIFDLVDKNNIILLGRILPYHTQDISKDKLRAWYLKFGCKPVDPQNEDGLWVRYPPGSSEVPIEIDTLTEYKIIKGFSETDFSDRVNFIKYTTVIAAILLLLLNVK